MNTTQPATFNTRVPREINMFIEMIWDVYLEFENVKWSKKSEIEIGFNYFEKKKKTEYFFGIWFDLWEQYGLPLSFCLSYEGKAPIEWHLKLRKYIAEKYDEGIIIKDYEGWTCVLFEYSFFKFDKGDDIQALVDLYYDVSEYADSLVK